MLKTSIKSFIQLFRSQKVRSQLHRGIIQVTIGAIISFLILGLLESIFYFTIPVRMKTVEFIILFFFMAVVFISLRYYLNRYSLFNNSSDHSLSQEFESRDPHIGDHLLNALQLEESMENIDDGKDLAKYAISKLNDELDKIPRNSLYDPISRFLKETLGITIITAVILFMVFMNSLPQAFVRLVQPEEVNS